MPFGGIGPSGRKLSLCVYAQEELSLASHQTGCTPVDTALTYSRISVQLWIPLDGSYLLLDNWHL